MYELNQDNEKHEISSELFSFLQTSLTYQTTFNGKFNIFVGSLVKKWQSALENGQVLPSNEINGEVEKIQNTSIVLTQEGNKFYAARQGEGEIDLGAITKGYTLDYVSSYFRNVEVEKYSVNCGSSSIVIGKSEEESNDFRIILKDIPNKCFYAHDVFIGTSGVSERGKVIDGVQYSHIVNPTTGSAINNYDMAYVIGSNGALCDVLSTVFMISSVDEVKVYEANFDVKVLLYKNNEIVHKSDSFELSDYNG